MLIFLLLFSTSFFLTLVFTFIAKKISLDRNFCDNPDSDHLKVHKTLIPFTGGGAVICAFLLVSAFAWILKKNGFLDFKTDQLLAIFIGSIISWLYGLWDDTRWQRRIKTGQSTKIFFQIPIVFTLALILYIVQIQWQFIPLAIIGILMSAFYLLFIPNAVNIQDGLDGLLGGLILISSLGFFVISFLTGNIIGLVLSSILVGNTFAFLFFNWHPASIFMGNNGSYFLGFIMTVFIIMNTKSGNLVWFFGPPLILGMPLFNAVYVFLRRGIKRQSLFSADRYHFYDKLYKMTGSVPKSVLINFLIHLVFVITGILIIIKFS